MVESKDKVISPVSPIFGEDQMNGPTFNNAQEFIHSLFGSKSILKVGALRIVPIKKGYRVEIDARRKEPKKKIGKPT